MPKGEVDMSFTGVKVFSATKAKDREELGEHVTRWIRDNPDAAIVDKIVTQSSDREFHPSARRSTRSPGRLDRDSHVTTMTAPGERPV
jgi:hypothetical protein